MHLLAARKIVELCQRREAAGDCPTEPPMSVEMLEDCVLTLAQQLAATARDGARLAALAKRAFVLLDDLSDNAECRRDHHGLCQTHLLERNCSNAAARALLDEWAKRPDDVEESVAAAFNDGARE